MTAAGTGWRAMLMSFETGTGQTNLFFSGWKASFVYRGLCHTGERTLAWTTWRRGEGG